MSQLFLKISSQVVSSTIGICAVDETDLVVECPEVIYITKAEDTKCAEID